MKQSAICFRITLQRPVAGGSPDRAETSAPSGVTLFPDAC
jgi:hypothetical protein